MTIKELSVGQRIKMFREIKGLSQDTLGEKINVSPKTISAWETGEREVNLNNIKYLADFFNISEPYLLYGIEEENLSIDLKEKIESYLEEKHRLSLVNRIYNMCKQVMEENGIVYSKDYLPVYDNENNKFSDGGIFQLDRLPIANVEKRRTFGYTTEEVILEDKIENKNYYVFDIQGLSENELYEIIEKNFSDKLFLTSLINSDSISLFDIALNNVKNNKEKVNESYTCFDNKKTYSYSEEFEMKELNDTLENLNPNLSNFWYFIVKLIENGAYYVKQYSSQSYDSVYVSEVCDVSKTNLVYRHALDCINNK